VSTSDGDTSAFLRSARVAVSDDPLTTTSRDWSRVVGIYLFHSPHVSWLLESIVFPFLWCRRHSSVTRSLGPLSVSPRSHPSRPIAASLSRNGIARIRIYPSISVYVRSIKFPFLWPRGRGRDTLFVECARSTLRDKYFHACSSHSLIASAMRRDLRDSIQLGPNAILKLSWNFGA